MRWELLLCTSYLWRNSGWRYQTACPVSLSKWAMKVDFSSKTSGPRALISLDSSSSDIIVFVNSSSQPVPSSFLCSYYQFHLSYLPAGLKLYLSTFLANLRGTLSSHWLIKPLDLQNVNYLSAEVHLAENPLGCFF